MAVWRRAVKPMFARNKWRILRGDQVMIISGKDNGQIGTVTKVIRDERFPRVIVEGLNLVRFANDEWPYTIPMAQYFHFVISSIIVIH